MGKITATGSETPRPAYAGLSCVLDMAHSSILETSALLPLKDAQPPARSDSQAVCRALRHALNRGEFTTKVDYKIGDSRIQIELAVSLERHQSPSTGKTYDEFTLHLTPMGGKQPTQIVVGFGRALKGGRKRKSGEADGTTGVWEHWITLRGNSSTILSKQNAHPIARTMGNLANAGSPLLRTHLPRRPASCSVRR